MGSAGAGVEAGAGADVGVGDGGGIWKHDGVAFGLVWAVVADHRVHAGLWPLLTAGATSCWMGVARC